MAQQILGEFEELVLLMVAAMHDEAYGVSILEGLEKELKKPLNISAIHVALKRMEDKGFVKSRFGGLPKTAEGDERSFTR